MSTWGTLLSDIRTDLKDIGTTPRWTDAALYLWAKDAIRDYSLHFPLEKFGVELTLSNGSYALPSDCIQVISVECPLGRFLDKRLGRPVSPSGSTTTHYFISQGSLRLNSPTSEVPVLNYEAIHPAPISAADLTFVSTIPMMDEELIRLYVKAKANEQLRTQQAGLDRFKLGTGDRQDNPLEPEVEGVMRAYYNKISERKGGRTVLLHKQR